MNRKPNKKMIGLFSVIALSLFISVILMFIGDKIFNKDGDQLVMYFEESINGLIIGSPVSFRGVEIGKVSRIDLMADIKDTNFSIPVFVKLNQDQNFRAEDFRKIKDKNLFLEELIKKGLRARLSTQSYLTGQLMIELEMLPNTPAIFKNNDYFKDTIEIPTALSPMSELSQGLKDLPVKEIIDNLNTFIDALNKKVPSILNETDILVRNLNKTFSDNVGGIPATVNNLNKTLIDIGESARSIKNLADFLERHPEALLKGKGRGGY